jgi:hypothetical protein
MKAKKEHRVPLSPRAFAIVRDVTAFTVAHADADNAGDKAGAFIFPGGKKGRGLSNMAMTAVLRRMGHGDITVHGFRSTFRDWAAERTNFPNEVVEMALAHAVGDKVEAAYRRGATKAHGRLGGILRGAGCWQDRSFAAKGVGAGGWGFFGGRWGMSGARRWGSLPRSRTVQRGRGESCSHPTHRARW